MPKKTNQNRRNFLKLTAAGAAGIAIATPVEKVFAASSRTANGTAPLNKWPGRVVINFDKSLATGNTAPNATQIARIKTMVDESIKLLTGQTTVGAAWKSIFPTTLTATSKIAIKVPVGINGGNSLTQPHYASVQAVVSGLKLMDFGGTAFPASNITIYDGNGTNNFNAVGLNATNLPGVNFSFGQSSNYTDGAENNASPGVKQSYATALNAAQFLINIFTPRGHSNYAENFTLGFKNHYGTYPTAYHDTANTPQYLRNINATGPVYQKNILSMCSGIYGQYESNGPSGTPQNYNVYSKFMDSTSTNTNPTTIIMGTDPVSVEMQAIKMMRIQGAGKYTTADMPKFLKASAGVVVTGTNWPPNPTLVNAMDNIGIIDESAMTILRIINGVIPTSIKDVQMPKNHPNGSSINATSIQGKSTFIEFSLPIDHVGKNATVEIYDVKGSLVAAIDHKVSGILNHFSWNQSDRSGRSVGKGMYIVNLISSGIRVSTKLSIVK